VFVDRGPSLTAVTTGELFGAVSGVIDDGPFRNTAVRVVSSEGCPESAVPGIDCCCADAVTPRMIAMKVLSNFILVNESCRNLMEKKSRKNDKGHHAS
jgi:hypothetical protein